MYSDNIYGYLLTNEREYIIIILLIYIIYNTNNIIQQLIILIFIIIHIVKLYKNYKFNNNVFRSNKDVYFYNALLFISLIIYMLNNKYYIVFVLLFIITRFLINKKTRNISYNKIKAVKNKNVIILLLLGILIYPNYKYKYFLWMDLINHLLIELY